MKKERKTWALCLEDVLVPVPLHDDVQHGGEEPAVPPRLVLRAAGHRVRDVAERPVSIVTLIRESNSSGTGSNVILIIPDRLATKYKPSK